MKDFMDRLLFLVVRVVGLGIKERGGRRGCCHEVGVSGLVLVRGKLNREDEVRRLELTRDLVRHYQSCFGCGQSRRS